MRNKKHILTLRNKKKKSVNDFPHFRKYYKSGHPALIVGEDKTHDDEEWQFRKVMHSPKDGRHNNEMVFPNPNINDSEPMYIVKRVRHDSKRNFSSWKYPWRYSKHKKSNAPRK